MGPTRLPAVAAFRHAGAREAVEVVFVRTLAEGVRIEGHVTAVEEAAPFHLAFGLVVDRDWRTRRAEVTLRAPGGTRQTTIEGDGAGSWRVDGAAAPHLDGCLDVDLEASAFTNALPVGRAGLDVGAAAGAPAAYVRTGGLEVARLAQTYRREPDGERGPVYAYEAPVFAFSCRISYDPDGVVLDYPGIAERIPLGLSGTPDAG